MADSAPPVASTPEVWVGSYRVLRPLGVGGMSSVFHAVHGESGLEVALKVLPRSLAKNPTLLRRFLREAQSAEALEHPSIVAIYDRGVDQGRHYLVLEYIAGGDLHERVRNFGPLPIAESIAIIRESAAALNYAAAHGVIHRDVKPANLLLTPDGNVKVTDLGLALQTTDEDERVTRDGTTVGTIDYMAPEQARDSRATSVRSDIYSLGCTFYYLLTGVSPFAGGDVAQKLRRHAIEPPPDLRKVRPEASTQLSRLIQKMMAKTPAARYADYEQLIQALNELPSTEYDADGDPQLVPLDEEAEPAGPWLKPGDSTRLGRAATVEMPTSEAQTRPLVPVADPGPGPKPETSEPRLREILDEEEAIVPHLPPPSFVARRAPEPSTHEYIVRGIMIGLAIAVVGFGIRQAASRLTGSPKAEAGQPEIRRVHPAGAPDEQDVPSDEQVTIPGEPAPTP